MKRKLNNLRRIYYWKTYKHFPMFSLFFLSTSNVEDLNFCFPLKFLSIQIFKNLIKVIYLNYHSFVLADKFTTAMT